MLINKKGITLIALIITIIVLLILVAVTINMVLGENGLINKSKISIEKYSVEEAKERIVQALATMKMDRTINKLDINGVDCLFESAQGGGLKQYDNRIDSIEKFDNKAIIIYDGKFEYEIDENLNIKYVGHAYTNDRVSPTVTIILNNSEDFLFAIKANISISDENGINRNQCKYVFDENNQDIKDETLYSEGIIPENGIIEKIKEPGTYYLHIMAKDVKGNTTYTTSSTSVTITNVANYDYYEVNENGAERTVQVLPGKYKLEVWGAQGGTYTETYRGGYGGYSVGEITFTETTPIFINVGGAGEFKYGVNQTKGGYNGGGASNNTNSEANCGSGGGATHIALDSGLLSTFSGKTDRLLIVAGGGGGANFWYNASNNYSYGTGGSGGGYIAGDGVSNYRLNSSSFGGNATGGTQTSGGAYGRAKNSWGYFNEGFGSFGKGGPSSQSGWSGGGGGFYGGGAGSAVGAGGGSGYIGNELLSNKHMAGYSVVVTEDSEANRNIKTILANTSNPNPIADTAKENNGYARITKL